MNIIEKLFAKTKAFAKSKDCTIVVAVKGNSHEMAAIMISCANKLIRSGAMDKEKLIEMIGELVKEGEE